MVNPNINRVSTTLSAAEIAAIDNGFSSIGTALEPHVQALVEEERKDFLGASDKNQSLADDALKQGQLLVAQLPPGVQNMVNNLKTDTDFDEQLEKIENTQVLQLARRIKDTRRLVWHERYAQALAIYKIIKTNAELGLPDFQAAYDILKVHFAGRGRPKGDEI